MKYTLNQADQDEITENLERLNELLKKYNPNTSSKVSGIMYFVFCGIAFVAISTLINALIGTISLCVFAAPYLFGNKSRDRSDVINKEASLNV